MPSYYVELVISATVKADTPEAAEAVAPILAKEKFSREGVAGLIVQAAEETQGDA